MSATIVLTLAEELIRELTEADDHDLVDHPMHKTLRTIILCNAKRKVKALNELRDAQACTCATTDHAGAEHACPYDRDVLDRHHNCRCCPVCTENCTSNI